MTQPPQSGPWGAQPPQQPGNWQGYPGGQPGPQGQWNPQQQWPTPTPAPQKKGPLKWILGAIALIAVIAVTAVVAVSCAGGNGTNNAGGGTPTSGSKSDIASANDTGPVSVITEDPSCAPWGPINDTLANSVKNGWETRDPSIPATSWSPEMRAMYQSTSEAFRNSADQTLPLVKITTHRVMRELYQQYVAYIRTFLNHVSDYTKRDNELITAATVIGSVINGVCQAITFHSASARGPLVAPIEPPKHVSTIGELGRPEVFMSTESADCSDWKSTTDEMTSDPAFAAWAKGDPSIPASDWSVDDKAVHSAVQPVLTSAADAFEKLGRQSSSAVVEDFGALAAQYGRAYVAGMSTYTSADQYLFLVFRRTPGAILSACQAVGSN